MTSHQNSLDHMKELLKQHVKLPGEISSVPDLNADAQQESPSKRLQELEALVKKATSPVQDIQADDTSQARLAELIKLTEAAMKKEE